ncbi:MAG: rhodanese-like domain-containing protein [Bacteroidetes bacterium]|jgi:rhodanese-related sulfurtransferase|nr:rhodanese-like domain-containing protein [Bacteroidota bacterium]MBT6685632.1 rhodanese-like domain-containing protein [Bacteroidota bacterium]MBT7141851.1 rhodanese-like domain-containing protein [Bacteroidota bacterium]
MKKSIYYSLIILSVLIMCTVGCKEVKVIKTVDEMVLEAQTNVPQISPEDLKTIIDTAEMYLIIDVREKNEYDKAYIPGAINIPRGLVEFRIAKESFWEEEMLYMPLKEELIILCCKKGQRGALSASALQSMGYTNVMNVEGGLNAWKAAYSDLVEKNEVVTSGPKMMATGSDSDDGGC